jgi:pre-mRNA-splicing helicase BRR2
MYRRIA